MKDPLDEYDRAILEALCHNARLSWRELAEMIGVSAPTVRERVQRLQDNGVIEGFTVELSPKALGYTLEALVRFKPLPGKVHSLRARLQETKRIVQCDKVTGEDAFVARILLRDISELDGLLDGLSHLATTQTSIVKSSPVKTRAPDF